MLWAWNVVFVCNTESIFLCASRPQRLSPPATHYHFNHCPGKRHIIHAECHTRWIITAKRHKLTFQSVELNISLVTKVFTNVSKFPDVAKLIFLARETDRHIDILLTTIRNNNCKLKQYSGRLQERILQHIYDYYKQIEHEYSTESCCVCRLKDKPTAELTSGLAHSRLLLHRRYLPHDARPARYMLWPCVCHKSEFHWNSWTNRAGFWLGSFL